ncbi:helix-turn-helix transcriptional regulator [Streptomyces sp. ME19-01-6]|uniref:helix-turn-helix domain-containing protein n=1 Tax=Streptomyces sp. ME19-01-6 TaxID=3028686 RepID=UPI0029B825FA|nr:helix-turn-helix transcriptional regulator [Streptomyces sp. ME19-01-6]MDX3229556.1 helix-turn-helix transcriptional regulator [Streptomyces sp. ME19-01-6]
MAPRSTPTGRQRRLAVELRRMREQAGVSIQQAAAMLCADRTMISNVEAARTRLSEDRVRQLACNYGCADEALINALAAMTGSRRNQDWWMEYRGKLPDGFLDISEIEHHATRIRTAQTVHLPGLLQTEEHARALFDLVVPKLPRLQVELRVAHRLGRQGIFAREEPTPYVAIIHEAALRMQFGGREVARAQLEYLADSADRDNITLLVIPFSAGSFPGAGQSILYAHGPVPQLDTVQLDTAYGSHFADAPTPLANYRALLDLMEDSALPPDESQKLIRSIARDM